MTISKIRFLESEGLVEPARTPSGYRKFSQADVERLRYVLAAQRDQYLPLRVIKEHLDAIDRGLEPPPCRATGPGCLAARTSRCRGRGRWPRRASSYGSRASELMPAAGIDAELLDADREVRPGRPGARVAAHVGEPRRRGATTTPTPCRWPAVAEMAAYGLEPRHLRAFRTGAEREAGLVEQVVAPLLRQRNPEARARAEEVARELGALSVRLHTALVRARLRDIVGT